MMLTDKQKQMLQENLDPRHVKSRRQAGRDLSYVDGFYVIDRLNAIFGPGGWSYTVQPTLAERHEVGDKWRVTYTCLCNLVVPGCSITDVGAGHGIDKDVGQAHESGIKEAATDSLKRCARALGRSMGLALYQEGHEHVGETKTPDQIAAERKLETPEETAARQEKHHPSWTKDRGFFMKRLVGPAAEGGLEFPYDDFLSFLSWLKKADFVKPSDMDHDTREKMLRWMKTPEADTQRVKWMAEVIRR